MSIKRNPQLDSILYWVKHFRVITIVLICWTMFWGWKAFQFVNHHFKEMNDFVVAFYISIVAGAIWCVKFWTSTHAAPHVSEEVKEPCEK